MSVIITNYFEDDAAEYLVVFSSGSSYHYQRRDVCIIVVVWMIAVDGWMLHEIHIIKTHFLKTSLINKKVSLKMIIGDYIDQKVTRQYVYGMVAKHPNILCLLSIVRTTHWKNLVA